MDEQRTGQEGEQVRVSLRALHDDQGSAAFRAAAVAIVALRQSYTYEDLPDWTGRSLEYRDAIERLYRQSEVPPDSESPIQAKLRYHIGNVLRETSPSEDLEKLGLAVAGPKGRAQEKRATGTTRRRQPAEVTRTRIDSPLVIAALGLDAVKVLRAMDIQGEDKDLVDGLVKKILDEAVEYLRGS